jgi:hypothetical protein
MDDDFIQSNEWKTVKVSNIDTNPNRKFVVDLEYYEITNMSIKENIFTVELKEKERRK